MGRPRGGTNNSHSKEEMQLLIFIAFSIFGRRDTDVLGEEPAEV